MRMLSIFFLLLLLSGLGQACSNRVENFYAFTLKGDVTLVDGTKATGPIYVELYHAEVSGEGELTYPLKRFQTIKLDKLGSFDQRIEYPSDRGSGLVVYAWVDQDKDRRLCSPTTRTEVADLVEVLGFPVRNAKVKLELQAACTGPEALYP